MWIGMAPSVMGFGNPSVLVPGLLNPTDPIQLTWIQFYV